MPMTVVAFRLSQRDVAALDRLRGRTDRSTYLRRLLRAEARRTPGEPEPDEQPEGNDIVVSAKRLAELNALTMDT